MNLSICIITKNECERLEKCLRAALGYGFEIVVVDTGSTDGTIEMVRKYTPALYEFQWIADFAAAKNFAASKASNDFVMILDSDEYLRQPSKEQIESLLSLVAGNSDNVGRMQRINQISQNGELTEYIDWTNRIFDRNKFCFKGKIHEQLVRGSVFTGPSENWDKIYTTYLTGMTADHDGYMGTPEQLRAKAERNATMLLKELEDKPDDTYILYQIGKSYFMIEDYERAAQYMGRALEYEVEPRLEYVIDLVESYGYALIECGRAAEAVLLESVESEFGHSADFRFMMGLAYMNNASFDKAIESFEMAARVQPSKMKGVDSYLAFYNCGIICECLGRLEQARKYYSMCGDYDRAKDRLKNI